MQLPMMSPAQQGKIRQVSQATLQPVNEVMSFTPGQGPVTAREHTAAIPHRQGAALGGLHHPGGTAHIQRLARCPTQHRGQQDSRSP
jgi:hypothetical protein